MGFFSKFRKWMGAEEPTEKVEQPAASVEKQPDDAEAARDVVAQPSESAGAVDAADAAEAAKDAASEASVSEEDAPATSESAPEAVATAPASEEAPAAPASSDVAEPEAAEVVQAENVAEADVAAPAQPEEPVAEAADTAKDAASEAPVSEEDAPAASEPAPEAVAAAPAVEEDTPAAPASSDVAESEAAEVVQAENVAEADVAAPAQPEEPVADAADTAKDAASEASLPEENAPAASEPAPEAVAAAPAAEEALAVPASSDVAEPEAAEAVQAENVAEADVAAPAQPEEPVAEAVDTAQDAPSEASLLEEDAPAASEPAPEAVAAAPAAEEDASASPDVAEPETAEAPQAETVAAPVSPAPEVKPRKKKGWFASLFGGSDDEEEEKPAPAATAAPAADFDDAAMTLRLREADPSLSAWLAIVLDGVEEAGDELWRRLRFLLRSLDAPADEVDAFVDEFARWLERMEYHYIDEFRSELQYRLALALDMEDEEDERNRLFLKISDGLARTREQFSRQLNAIFSGHGELTEEFWENLEELFIMADLGYDASLALVERLRKRAADMGVVKTEGMRAVLRDEIEEIFRVPRKITAFNPPEVILFIGVNGVGKTTTIAKLAYRARMQGKKVMIAAADTFRAAAIEQLQVWAERVGALFHARAAGSDPASVAFEAMDRALAEQVDILFVDTAGRLQTKHNLMEELTKIRTVLGKKHPGAPHRTILALDATTGQNALSQAKLFKEAAGVDELILTKLDGTAKGGVAIAVAMQEHLPITYIGLGEKLEDLRPFNGDDYARALLGEGEIVGTGK